MLLLKQDTELILPYQNFVLRVNLLFAHFFIVCGASTMSNSFGSQLLNSVIRSLGALYILVPGLACCDWLMRYLLIFVTENFRIFCCTLPRSVFYSFGSLIKLQRWISDCVLWQMSFILKHFHSLKGQALRILQDLGLFLWPPGSC